uniref:Uncharacterized protein n=1 Tax=Arundo donax TaxID=35708 RepID=A0A0A8Z0V0_ARUDO
MSEEIPSWRGNGFSQGNCEHRPELYRAAVRIWDPGICSAASVLEQSVMLKYW